jgi:intracellular septation protein
VAQLLKLLLEVGPLVVFFIANGKWGIMVATAAFMAATAVALPLAWATSRQIPVMPLVSGAFVLAFGGLTLLLEDATFIKLKPTIVNLLFAAILTGGQVTNTPLLQKLFGTVLQLSERGWRLLTWRWIGFFVVLAALNEIVWRTQTTDVWIQFKLFAIMPLTLAFSLAQLPLIQRYQTAEAGTGQGRDIES